MTAPVIGLIPAAGQAIRIAPLPCSKELYPVGFRKVEGVAARPKVVCEYLLEKMHFAGIRSVYVVLRDGKWDIPTYLGDGSALNMNLAYLTLRSSWGVPRTLDRAYEFVRETTVAFGFADILFNAHDGFARILDGLADRPSDLILGVCPRKPGAKSDGVEFDDTGAVRELIVNAPEQRPRFGWVIAAWKPAFTEFLHDFVCRFESSAPGRPEPSVGDAMQAAIKSGLRADAMVISDEPYLDIGTPAGLVAATMQGIAEVG